MLKSLPTLVLLGSTVVFAQYGSYNYGRSNPYATGQRSIDAIQSDLANIGQRAAWDRWAQRQFQDAISNLERYQQSAARGRFDRGRLDNSINALTRLLTAPELHARDKRTIAFHRDQLRMLRSGYR